jgi:hypothetical protein
VPDFEPNETQRMVRDAARKFAEERIAPAARALDREGRFPRELLRELAELGLMGVNVPERYGGAEAGAVAYALAMMEVARACASTAVTMAVNNMVAEVITRFGTDAQKERHVRAITSGAYAAASFALSEPQCGSDAAALRTRAVRSSDGDWRLTGSKQWITSGDHAGVLVVWARSGGEGAKGISAFLVEGGASGLHVGRHEDKMGLRASTTVSLALEDVPAELLGSEGEGFAIAMRALNGGRIGVGAQAVGIGRAALEAAVKYASDRRAFGRPIAEFQALRWKLADSAVELDAAALLVLRAAWLKEQDKPFVRESSMAKLFASEACNRVVDRAVQIHGGYGYIDEFPVERHFRDARVTTIYEGTSEIQRVVIAREILRD